MEQLDLSAAYRANEYAIHALRYLPLRSVVADLHVLDIACGEGLGSQLLARWGACQSISLPRRAARIHAADLQSVTFLASEACEFLETTDRTFDVIASVETIEHLAEPRRFLEGLRRCRSTEGKILISCPNDIYYYAAGSSLNEFHLATYSFEQFKTMSEEILGPADWGLGTVANGFSILPYSLTERRTNTYLEAISGTQDLEGGIAGLDPQDEAGLTPANAIFYIGAWGEIPVGAASAMLVPRGSDARIGRMKAVSDDLSAGLQRELTLVYSECEVLADEVDFLSRALDGKFAISQVSHDGDTVATCEALFESAAPPDHIHFMGLDVFGSVMKELESRAVFHELSDSVRSSLITAAISLQVLPDSGTVQHRELADIVLVQGQNAPLLWADADGNAGPNSSAVTRIGLAASPGVTQELRKQVETLGKPWKLLAINPRVAPLRRIRKMDAMICLDNTPAGCRVARLALQGAIPTILTHSHPLADHLLPEQAALSVCSKDDTNAILERLGHLEQNADRERLAQEAQQLDSRIGRTIAAKSWLHALTNAQLNHDRSGQAVRAAVFKTLSGYGVKTLVQERNRLRRERDRLAAQNTRGLETLTIMSDRIKQILS